MREPQLSNITYNISLLILTGGYTPTITDILFKTEVDYVSVSYTTQSKIREFYTLMQYLASFFDLL
jgi:hypothetical protein